MLQGIRSKFMSYFAQSCSLLESFNRFERLRLFLDATVWFWFMKSSIKEYMNKRNNRTLPDSIHYVSYFPHNPFVF